MDRISSDRRSWLMSRVSSRDTGPERVLRRILSRLGYRYRLHVRNLPGKPDIVFHGRGRAIFVHGCFWHQHPGCSKARVPRSRQDYWIPKLAKNRDRDAAIMALLEARGWSVSVVWQCETRDTDQLSERLIRFLGPPPHSQRRAPNAAFSPQPAFVVGQRDRRRPTGGVASRQIGNEIPT